MKILFADVYKTPYKRTEVLDAKVIYMLKSASMLISSCVYMTRQPIMSFVLLNICRAWQWNFSLHQLFSKILSSSKTVRLLVMPIAHLDEFSVMFSKWKFFNHSQANFISSPRQNFSRWQHPLWSQWILGIKWPLEHGKHRIKDPIFSPKSKNNSPFPISATATFGKWANTLNYGPL